jgi:hypothetical protein
MRLFLIGLICSIQTSWALDDLNVKSCSSFEVSQIRNAHQQLARVIQELQEQWHEVHLSKVKSTFVIPQNRVWLKNNPVHRDYLEYWISMRDQFEVMSLKFSSVKYRCENFRKSYCKQDEVSAYVLFYFSRPTSTLHLCPTFFNRTLQEQTATLFHEFSHFANSTEDLAYDWINGNKVDLKRASHDAYHFEHLSNLDIKSTLSRTIWNQLWPKKKSN